MKDPNDNNQTIDWVDIANDPRPELPPNPALDKALANIINVTLQDLLAEYN